MSLLSFLYDESRFSRANGDDKTLLSEHSDRQRKTHCVFVPKCNFQNVNSIHEWSQYSHIQRGTSSGQRGIVPLNTFHSGAYEQNAL